MEQSTPVSGVSSESVAGQFPSNDAFRNIQQEYSEQWHLLENLQSDLVSETHSEDRQDSAASLQNSTVSNANTQDTEPTGYQQEKEDTEEWFVLGEDAVGVGAEAAVPSEDEEVTTKGNVSDTNKEQKGEHVQQVGLVLCPVIKAVMQNK
ncbi:hypothetical protein OS493_032543 [Desmophyllum pertusum]|uniref:Uncharacterized protein n=1 Tax=Desmophyllum pertusum TaxID=174260 RepID=A0A9W9YVS0_9CNID|nr:hypothetical protein OS493_032543 [Desmophyllum pertusum]